MNVEDGIGHETRDRCRPEGVDSTKETSMDMGKGLGGLAAERVSRGRRGRVG